MKRMHIHVGVEKLDDGIRFYNALFGTEPAKATHDYAKWMLDDPRLNFAISTRVKAGVDHLGLQVEEEIELEELRERLKQADMSLFDEGETVCCYARSDKSWVQDPAGTAWEAYRHMKDVQFHSEKTPKIDQGACCPGESEAVDACCVPSESTIGNKSGKAA